MKCRQAEVRQLDVEDITDAKIIMYTHGFSQTPWKTDWIKRCCTGWKICHPRRKTLVMNRAYVLTEATGLLRLYWMNNVSVMSD